MSLSSHSHYRLVCFGHLGRSFDGLNVWLEGLPRQLKRGTNSPKYSDWHSGGPARYSRLTTLPFRLRLHNRRNLFICLLGTWALFSVGSATGLSVASRDYVSPNVGLVPLSLELSLELTIFVAPLAVLVAFAYTYFFGGMLSTKAMRLYLFIMRGRHVVTPSKSEYADLSVKSGLHLKMRRQFIYFFCILCVVVSYATYLAKRRTLPLVSTATALTQ